MLLPSEIKQYRDELDALRRDDALFADLYSADDFEAWFNEHLPQIYEVEAELKKTRRSVVFASSVQEAFDKATDEWESDSENGLRICGKSATPHIKVDIELKPTMARAIVRTNFVQEVEVELTETMTRDELHDALIEKAVAGFHKAEPETFVTEIEIF